MRNCLQQEFGSVDCPVFCVHYIEKLPKGEKSDIPFLCLCYIERILVNVILKKFIPSEDVKKDATGKKDDGSEETATADEDAAAKEDTMIDLNA